MPVPKTKPMPKITIDGSKFRDEKGRMVILRGVNLGGDCKVPFPDGGTHRPTDFSDHRTVSFTGRPFPLEEADEHFSRLKAWGFNCLRLLTTWEAVEHEGPGKYDTAYLDYYTELCRLAGEYEFYVFVDFHQDVWSRMTGGDGAPGWLFEKVGLDFMKFHEAGAAHVMQYKYDYARGGRQEENYPTMTWSQNYRLPANGIMWTLFFAGRDFTPDFMIEGQNVQDYMQSHYLGAMREIARRLAHMPHVMGFDTLNEPGTGFIGEPVSYRHTGPSEVNPRIAAPGPAWSVLDCLAVARGVTRSIPQLEFSLEEMKSVVTHEKTENPTGISIWLEGHGCPFEAAGVYSMEGGELKVADEEYFRKVKGTPVTVEDTYMAPFFKKVAETVQSIREDWLVFAELDPFTGLLGGAFPEETPEGTVNASHWYDIVTLSTKTFMYPTSVNPFSGKVLEGREAIEAHYAKQLSRIRDTARTLNGGKGAPTLIGECGIPFDLDGGAAYEAFRAGDHSQKPWEKHIMALDFLYNALDALHLSSAQWNYTASNSNDLAVGDGWNQEDLSIWSRDQQVDSQNIHSGGRALHGFVRPYAKAIAGTLQEISFERESRHFEMTYEAAGSEATEVFLPAVQYPEGANLTVDGGEATYNGHTQMLAITALKDGPVTITITPR